MIRHHDRSSEFEGTNLLKEIQTFSSVRETPLRHQERTLGKDAIGGNQCENPKKILHCELAWISRRSEAATMKSLRLWHT